MATAYKVTVEKSVSLLVKATWKMEVFFWGI